MTGPISPVVVDALDRVVSDNGWLAASRPGSLRASLSDVLGSAADEHRAELDAVVVSAEEGVPTELRTSGRGAAVALAPELTQRLVSWGMAEDLAASVVEAWTSLLPEVSRSAPAVGDNQTVVSAVVPTPAPTPAPTQDPASTPTPVPAAAAAASEPDADPSGDAGPGDTMFRPPPEPPPLTELPVATASPARRADRSRTTVWVAAAAAVAVVVVGGAWLGLRSRDHQTETPLLASLSYANTHYAMGLIPTGSCKTSTDHVICTNPNSAVTSLDVRTYPDKQSLYAAYVAAAERLRGAPLKVNTGDCNSHQRSGERSWNHAFQHPLMYSVQDHISKDLTIGDKAQGRLACQVTGSYMTILWTADAGNMLGEVQGPVMGLFPAWKLIHHGITPPGAAPMNDMDGGSPSPSASSSSMGMS